jgi:hypothetical protein
VKFNTTLLFANLQNPYVYLVLIVEAIATYVGNLCVLSLIALFGAATTAMVCGKYKCWSDINF